MDFDQLDKDHSISKEQALELISKILDDPDGPYLDIHNRHPRFKQDKALKVVSNLYDIAYGKRELTSNQQGGRTMNNFSNDQIKAQVELNNLINNMDGPYFNIGHKFTKLEQDEAVERANALRGVIAGESSLDDSEEYSTEDQDNAEEIITITPEEASIQLNNMRSDLNSDLMNPNALPQKHKLAVLRQHDLMRIEKGETVDLREHVNTYHEEEKQSFINRYGYDPNTPRKSAGGFNPFEAKKVSIDPASVGYGEKNLKSAYKNKIEDDSED